VSAGVLVLAFFAGRAEAEPVVGSVEGTLEEGETFTILGEAFGERAAAPIAWDDFEAGTLGDPPGAPWETSSTTAGGTPRLDNGMLRRGSEHSLVCDFTGTNDESSFGLSRDLGEVFLSAWRDVRITGSFTTRWTAMRIEGGSATGYPEWTQVFLGGDGHGATWVVGASDDVTCDVDPSDQGGLGDGIAETRRWIREDYWLRASSPGVADGHMEIWRDHVLEGYSAFSPDAGAVVPVGPEVVTRCGDDSWTSLSIGATWLHEGGGDAAIWFDDVYLDDTPARVEIGNGPTWESTTISEIQPSTSWSDGAIDVRVHEGSLYVGAGYWLYVFDDENRPSEGFPIQLGASYDDTPDAGVPDAGSGTRPADGCGCSQAEPPARGGVACLWAVFWAGWRHEKANRNRHGSARTGGLGSQLSRGVPRGCAGHR